MADSFYGREEGSRSGGKRGGVFSHWAWAKKDLRAGLRRPRHSTLPYHCTRERTWEPWGLSINFQLHFLVRIEIFCRINVRQKLAYLPSQFLTFYLDCPVSFEKCPQENVNSFPAPPHRYLCVYAYDENPYLSWPTHWTQLLEQVEMNKISNWLKVC